MINSSKSINQLTNDVNVNDLNNIENKQIASYSTNNKKNKKFYDTKKIYKNESNLVHSSNYPINSRTINAAMIVTNNNDSQIVKPIQPTVTVQNALDSKKIHLVPVAGVTKAEFASVIVGKMFSHFTKNLCNISSPSISKDGAVRVTINFEVKPKDPQLQPVKLARKLVNRVVNKIALPPAEVTKMFKQAAPKTIFSTSGQQCLVYGSTRLIDSINQDMYNFMNSVCPNTKNEIKKLNYLNFGAVDDLISLAPSLKTFFFNCWSNVLSILAVRVHKDKPGFTIQPRKNVEFRGSQEDVNNYSSLNSHVSQLLEVSGLSSALKTMVYLGISSQPAILGEKIQNGGSTTYFTGFNRYLKMPLFTMVGATNDDIRLGLEQLVNARELDAAIWYLALATGSVNDAIYGLRLALVSLNWTKLDALPEVIFGAASLLSYLCSKVGLPATTITMGQRHLNACVVMSSLFNYISTNHLINYRFELKMGATFQHNHASNYLQLLRSHKGASYGVPERTCAWLSDLYLMLFSLGPNVFEHLATATWEYIIKDETTIMDVLIYDFTRTKAGKNHMSHIFFRDMVIPDSQAREKLDQTIKGNKMNDEDRMTAFWVECLHSDFVPHQSTRSFVHLRSIPNKYSDLMQTVVFVEITSMNMTDYDDHKIEYLHQPRIVDPKTQGKLLDVERARYNTDVTDISGMDKDNNRNTSAAIIHHHSLTTAIDENAKDLKKFQGYRKPIVATGCRGKTFVTTSRQSIVPEDMQHQQPFEPNPTQPIQHDVPKIPVINHAKKENKRIYYGIMFDMNNRKTTSILKDLVDLKNKFIDLQDKTKWAAIIAKSNQKVAIPTFDKYTPKHWNSFVQARWKQMKYNIAEGMIYIRDNINATKLAGYEVKVRNWLNGCDFNFMQENCASEIALCGYELGRALETCAILIGLLVDGVIDNHYQLTDQDYGTIWLVTDFLVNFVKFSKTYVTIDRIYRDKIFGHFINYFVPLERIQMNELISSGVVNNKVHDYISNVITSEVIAETQPQEQSIEFQNNANQGPPPPQVHTEIKYIGKFPYRQLVPNTFTDNQFGQSEESEYLIEPQIQQQPQGLRDIQMDTTHRSDHVQYMDDYESDDEVQNRKEDEKNQFFESQGQEEEEDDDDDDQRHVHNYALNNELEANDERQAPLLNETEEDEQFTITEYLDTTGGLGTRQIVTSVPTIDDVE